MYSENNLELPSGLRYSSFLEYLQLCQSRSAYVTRPGSGRSERQKLSDHNLLVLHRKSNIKREA